jgi:hypothetical protein
MFLFRGITDEAVENRAMQASFPSITDITIPQLLERERSLRVLASTALTIEESNALLALVEHYETLVTERQNQEETEHRRDRPGN